jgi:hypothetical protein
LASLIPAYPAGTEVQYYISADNGKHQVRPIVAPEGYFKFKVLGEPANQLLHRIFYIPWMQLFSLILPFHIPVAILMEPMDQQMYINGEVWLPAKPYLYL